MGVGVEVVVIALAIVCVGRIEQAGMDGLMGRRMDGVMGCGGRGGKSSRAGNAVLCLDLKLMGAHSTLTKGGRACIQCLGVYSG